MENSQQLATESFSYSWLIDKSLNNNSNTLSENPDDNEQRKQYDFNFDFPLASPQTAPPVHADEIFSGGHIMPLYIDRSKIDARRNHKSAPPSPVVSSHSSSVDRDFLLIGKWRKSSRKNIRRFCGFLKALVGCSRKSNRVDDFERVEFEASPNVRPSSVSSVVDWPEFEKVGGSKVDFYLGVKKVNKSWSNSPQGGSPRMTSPPCSGNYSWSCDVESSIHEAILYCKKSIEK